MKVWQRDNSQNKIDARQKDTDSYKKVRTLKEGFLYSKDSPMYSHSLLKILHVLSITRRKPGLPVVSESTVDDIKMVVNNSLRKVDW